MTRTDQANTNADTESLGGTTYQAYFLSIDREGPEANAKRVTQASITMQKVDAYWKLLWTFIEDNPQYRGMISECETNGFLDGRQSGARQFWHEPQHQNISRFRYFDNRSAYSCVHTGL